MACTLLRFKIRMFKGAGLEILVFQRHHDVVIPPHANRLPVTRECRAGQAIWISGKTCDVQGHDGVAWKYIRTGTDRITISRSRQSMSFLRMTGSSEPGKGPALQGSFRMFSPVLGCYECPWPSLDGQAGCEPLSPAAMRPSLNSRIYSSIERLPSGNGQSIS